MNGERSIRERIERLPDDALAELQTILIQERENRRRRRVVTIADEIIEALEAAENFGFTVKIICDGNTMTIDRRSEWDVDVF